VAGEASNGEDALRLARRLRPDVVLMDLLMPVMDGVTAMRAIRAELPDTEILALVGAGEGTPAGAAMRAGAIAYLRKDAGAAELIDAIKAAAGGQMEVSPHAVLVEEITEPAEGLVLSEREMDVLRLIARGYTNKEIARALGVGGETVKTHVGNILDKLGVESRTQAALSAIRRGLISPRGR
jgi:DNA-binding NarL/FixJ family response regulator